METQRLAGLRPPAHVKPTFRLGEGGFPWAHVLRLDVKGEGSMPRVSDTRFSNQMFVGKPKRNSMEITSWKHRKFFRWRVGGLPDDVIRHLRTSNLVRRCGFSMGPCTRLGSNVKGQCREVLHEVFCLPSLVMERRAIAESSTQGSQTLDRQSSPLAQADFISHLPDHLICHILSFLPTKDSVATSVLSKRWRPLWAHVPTLDLYTGNHSVHHVISLHEAQSLDSFFLEQENSDDFTESDLEEWMTYIIERNVKQIWLDLSPTDSVTLPNCLFSSRTLVTLGLVQCTLPTFSGPTSLPNLKRLNLLLVEYEVNSTLSRLLDGCPTLEELTVDGTANAFGQLIIRSSTLRRLELNSGIDGSDCSVVVDAPGLRRLKMGGYLYGLVQLYPMASLVEADICLSTGIFEEQVNFYAEGISMLRLLKRLCHVTKLKLSGYGMNFPNLKSADLYVKFNNLVRLELGADWCIIPKAFKSAENLKVLTIHNGYFHLKRWPEDLEGHSACLLYSLQTVTIHKFGCTEEELDVVRFILGNARVLERMEICSVTCGTSPEAKSKALERIRLFNRESEECELVFA